jgi:hypothetical protein
LFCNAHHAPVQSYLPHSARQSSVLDGYSASSRWSISNIVLHSQHVSLFSFLMATLCEHLYLALHRCTRVCIILAGQSHRPADCSTPPIQSDLQHLFQVHPRGLLSFCGTPSIAPAARSIPHLRAGPTSRTPSCLLHRPGCNRNLGINSYAGQASATSDHCSAPIYNLMTLCGLTCRL